MDGVRFDEAAAEHARRGLRRAAQALDDLADTAVGLGRGLGAAWWGPTADRWRSEVARDAVALAAMAADVRRLEVRLREVQAVARERRRITSLTLDA